MKLRFELACLQLAALLLLQQRAGVAAESAVEADGDASHGRSALVAQPPAARPAIGTKDAPVDGRDGKPHEGPFVVISASADAELSREKKTQGSKSNGKDSKSNDKHGDDGNGTGMGGKGRGRGSSAGGGSGNGSNRADKGRVGHAGTSNGEASGASESAALKRLSEELAQDGPVAIPESNDGVMDDKNRAAPKQGTTGTEGGVSAKSRKESEQAAKTTGKLSDPPKEAGPAAADGDVAAGPSDGAASDGPGGRGRDAVGGLDKPADLPEMTHNAPLPVPKSAGTAADATYNNRKDYDEDEDDDGDGSGGGSSDSSRHGRDGPGPGPGPDGDGMITPLHSYVLALSMIIVSEIGDKTFLVAALMAMRHPRAVVFSAAFSALAAMTILSALLGHAVPQLLPKRLTTLLGAALFLFFGARLLHEGYGMTGQEGVGKEMQEVEMELDEKEGGQRAAAAAAGGGGGATSLYGLEAGYGGGADSTTGHVRAHSRRSRSTARNSRTRRSRSSSASSSASGSGGSAALSPASISPRATPSTTTTTPGSRAHRTQQQRRRGMSRSSKSMKQSPLLLSSSSSSAATSAASVLAGLQNLAGLLLSPAWVQTFAMTFLGEWGDRSQIATIAMAAGKDYWWVSAGAVCGHGLCTALAVLGGRAVAGRVSLRAVTVGGGVAFVVFGVIYLVEGAYYL